MTKTKEKKLEKLFKCAQKPRIKPMTRSQKLANTQMAFNALFKASINYMKKCENAHKKYNCGEQFNEAVKLNGFAEFHPRNVIECYETMQILLENVLSNQMVESDSLESALDFDCDGTDNEIANRTTCKKVAAPKKK